MLKGISRPAWGVLLIKLVSYTCAVESPLSADSLKDSPLEPVELEKPRPPLRQACVLNFPLHPSLQHHELVDLTHRHCQGTLKRPVYAFEQLE